MHILYTMYVTALFLTVGHQVKMCNSSMISNEPSHLCAFLFLGDKAESANDVCMTICVDDHAALRYL